MSYAHTSKQVPWLLRMKNVQDFYLPANCSFPLKATSGIYQTAQSFWRQQMQSRDYHY